MLHDAQQSARNSIAHRIDVLHWCRIVANAKQNGCGQVAHLLNWQLVNCLVDCAWLQGCRVWLQLLDWRLWLSRTLEQGAMSFRLVVIAALAATTAAVIFPDPRHALDSCRAAFTGTLFAARGILFPELRGAHQATVPDEIPCEGICLAVQNWWLARADEVGLPGHYERHPTLVRYAFGLAFGCFLLGTMTVIQWAAAIYARWCMRVAFRVTGDARHPHASSQRDGHWRTSGRYRQAQQSWHSPCSVGQ